MEEKKKLDEKLKNLKYMAKDAKDVRVMERQKYKEKDEKIEFSRDNQFIKKVSGEDYSKNKRFKEDNIIIEPFNLNEENEEGYFDLQGNFIRRSKKGEEFDEWADNLEHEELKLKKETKQETKQEEEEIEVNETKLFQELNQLLLPNESITEALKRYSKEFEMKEKKDKDEKKKKKVKMICKEFEELTDIATKLLNIGYSNIYQDKKEKLLSFEYKFDGNEEIFGPFSYEQMKYWIENGGFKEYQPKVRRYGGDKFQNMNDLFKF